MAFSRSGGATSTSWYSMSPCCWPSLVAVMRRASRWKRFAKLGDRLRHGGRKHQRAPLGGRRGQNELEILAEAEVEHLVGLVQHHGAKLGNVEGAARDVVAQPARRADDDMGALFERPALLAHIHAADTGADACAGAGVKPFQFAPHLKRQFAGRGDHQRQRQAGRAEIFLDRAAMSARSRCRKRRSCRSRSGRRRAGRRRRLPPSAWPAAPASAFRSHGRPVRRPAPAPFFRSRSWIGFQRENKPAMRHSAAPAPNLTHP